MFPWLNYVGDQRCRYRDDRIFLVSLNLHRSRLESLCVFRLVSHGECYRGGPVVDTGEPRVRGG